MEESCSFICRERECLMRADQGMYKGNGTVTCISVSLYSTCTMYTCTCIISVHVNVYSTCTM